MKSTLRTFAFSFFFTLCSLNLHSQWVSIPDTNFGKWLNTNGYSQCLQGNSATGWQMDTTCPGVVGATSINCTSRNIYDLTGIQYFDNLTSLICRTNNLSGLPSLPGLLTYLDCTLNSLSSLPALPNSLSTLSCSDNPLGSLPSLPHSLSELICFNNQLTALPALPDSLKVLTCQGNLLTSLPTLPGSLTELTCYANQLTALPVLPSTLTYLQCGFNQIGSLPPLPNSLTHLLCYSNPLGILPALPNSLIELVCHDNELSFLPILPNSLNRLVCTYNQLTSLPALPNSLTNLQCDNNQLTILPELPDSLFIFYCYNNPNLHCLPKLKVVRSIQFSNIGLTCLPNYPEGNVYSTPLLNTVALCEGINANNCPVYWNISGNQYFDKNNNCVKDTSETFVNNVTVQLHSNGVLQKEMLTVYGGYSFVSETYGNYTVSVDTANLPFVVTCPDTGYFASVISAADSMDFSKDFGLECKPGFDVKAQSITTPTVFRPANNTLVNITAGDASNFYNAHCAAGISGSVTLSYTGPVQFVSAAPNAPTPTVSGNTLTYTIADFGNVNFFIDFNIVMHTDTTAQIGQQVCFTLTVNPIAGDNNPANNVLTHCFTVVASYDPNDKTAYPAGNIDTAQKELTYTIRFQNTGTAEAQHIYITDTLDTDVDASTFQLLAYSHQPIVQLKENAVRFNFPNINLPDSNTNEPLSHGYVQYKVKLKDNLPIGTVINNTAYIYFDFNAPVVTNTTVNTITTNTGIQAASHEPLAFRMFPNPSNGSVTISVDERLIGSTATVSDITGRVVAAVPLTTQNSTLTTTSFRSGVYFVTVGNRTQKLIIQY